jgi:2-dehydropantoate 2-reductase
MPVLQQISHARAQRRHAPRRPFDEPVRAETTAMKVCVVGAGAIGGMLAVRLAQAGHEVCVIVRGANLAAVRQHGMKLVLDEGTELVAPVRATDRLAEAGVQDLVLLALKAHQVAAVVPEIGHLLGPDTPIVTLQNGVPWWYFFRHGGPLEGRVVEAVDPGGAIARGVDVSRLIGSVVYPAAEIVAPGVIRHLEGNRFTLGELDGAESERVRVIAQAFREAGLRAPVVSDIRSEIWLKLWGNLTFNPVSALTHATLASICRFPLTRSLAARSMA